MPSYDSLKKKQSELIRKALDGSAFIAASNAVVPTTLTTATGTGATAVIELTALPAGYSDLGYLTDDGAGFSRDVSTSDVTSWGSVQPTRTDLVSDTTTISVTAQETNLFTLGLSTGKSFEALKTAGGTANTGEVSIAKPSRPSSQFYRLMTLAVDNGTSDGDIFIARFFPRIKVTAFGDQSFSAGDAPIEWPVTLQAFEDSTLGYSERWLFGGPGWKALMAKMGFTAVV